MPGDEVFERTHLRFAAAGVRRDEIVGQKLLEAVARVRRMEMLDEIQQRLVAGFTHRAQHDRIGVLGRELELSGDMVRDQFVNVRRAVARIGRDQVGTDAGCHEHLAHARQVTQTFEQVDLRAVVGLERGAAGREEASFGCAGALAGFARAFESVHVGGRAAHVLDDTGEGGVVRQAARLFQERAF